MSYVRFNISDRDGTVSGDLHGSLTDTLVAALTAEPETISEFESALHRFVKHESDWPPLRGFHQHEDLEPYDAGIVAIDLLGRTVGFETTYTIPRADGSVRVPSEFAREDDDIYIPYRVPDDWTFVETIPLYRGTRISNRQDRARRAPFDARPILFGRPLISHIVTSVARAPDLDDEDVFASIHTDWLMTTRNDLRDRTPREVLFEKQDFIDFDLHTRSLQWSFTKVCPPPLKTDSFAYINAGFGTHEWVLYYDLIRYLLADSAEMRMAGGPLEIESEIKRLSTLRDEWMRAPDSESYGRLPVEIIDLERRRVNMSMSSKEILIDDNCPCCVALAQDFDTPMFWHLDGCNMDDGFVFSSFKTMEEWETHNREMDEFNRDFERKQKEDPDWWKAGANPF
jgi:hypothetical protein